MLIIGLTGSIATGKSTVSSRIKEHGVPLIDLDIVARQVVEPGTPTLARLEAAFGSEILTDGHLNREKLGSIVFHDADKRRVLNGIIHPAVKRSMAAQLVHLWMQRCPLVVLDVPLLIESGIHQMCGVILVVYCSDAIQLRRLMDRNGFSQEEAQARVRAQMPIAEKLAHADVVLDNSGTKPELLAQVDRVLTRYKERETPLRTYLALIPPVQILLIVYWVARRWLKARRMHQRSARL